MAQSLLPAALAAAEAAATGVVRPPYEPRERSASVAGSTASAVPIGDGSLIEALLDIQASRKGGADTAG